MLLQPVSDESVLHRILRPNETKLFQPPVSNGDSRSIGNMEDWDVGLLGHLVVDLVGGISTEHDRLCAAGTQLHHCSCKGCRDFGPLILSLELVDSMLVQVVNN